MKLLIAVPSKARAQFLLKYTWAWLQQLPYDKRIFVETQDYDSYCQAGFEPWLQVMPECDQGLGYALTQIQAAAQGYDLIFRVDDDVQSWSRGHGDPESVAHSVELISTALESDILPTLEQYPHLAGITFDYLHFRRIHPDPNKKWIFYSRFRGQYVIKRDWFTPHANISALEDVYMTARIWANGGMTACYVPVAQRPNMNTLPGGMQAAVLRRAETHERTKQLIHQLFPLMDASPSGLDTWRRALRKAARQGIADGA